MSQEYCLCNKSTDYVHRVQCMSVEYSLCNKRTFCDPSVQFVSL